MYAWIQRYSAWLLVGACLIVHAVILAVMGQPLIYTGGYIKIWHGIVQSSENSQHITDWYTFSHIIHGFLFFWILYPLRNYLSVTQRLMLAIGIEVGWEVLENTNFIIDRYREATISLQYYGDSVINSVSDVLAMVLGYLAAERMRWPVVLVLLIIMEVVVGYLIRDNLLLNILMLVYPTDAVKMWQAGV